jgi:hypothetical protein
MSRKTTKATVATAVIAATVPAVQSEVKFGMDLDLRLDKNDLVNLAVSQAEEVLIVKRESNEVQLRDRTREHEKAVDRLKKLAQDKLDGFTLDDDTRELLRLLQIKTGHAYVTKIVNMSAGFYSHYDRKLKDEEAPDVNIEKMAIVGSARVYKKRGDDNYSSEIISWEVNIPFSQEMKEAVELIKDKTHEVQKVKDELAQISRMVFDLPRLRNRALRELTIAVASGKVRTMEDATNVVMQTQSKALPEIATMHQLPGGIIATASLSVSTDD